MASFPVVILALIGAVNSLATSEGKKQTVSEDGLGQIHPRVIGGNEVKDRCMPPYSYMAALQIVSPDGPLTFCSAVILNDTILVTTGLCATRAAAAVTPRAYAVLGERDLLMKDREEQKIGIESVKIHPGFNADTLDNDIALIRLETPGQMSACVSPAGKMETDPAACIDLDKSCLIAGWGPYVENNKPMNSRLARSASVTVFGDVVTGIWSSVEKLERPKGSLYAEAATPNVRACLYDWGGMVSCQRNGKYVLRGLISSPNCYTNKPLPMFVTDVPSFQGWLDGCQLYWDQC